MERSMPTESWEDQREQSNFEWDRWKEREKHKRTKERSIKEREDEEAEEAEEAERLRIRQKQERKEKSVEEKSRKSSRRTRSRSSTPWTHKEELAAVIAPEAERQFSLFVDRKLDAALMDPDRARRGDHVPEERVSPRPSHASLKQTLRGADKGRVGRQIPPRPQLQSRPATRAEVCDPRWAPAWAVRNHAEDEERKAREKT